MHRITIIRPAGNTSDVRYFTSAQECRDEAAKLRAKMKAAGADKEGWKIRVQTFKS